MAEAMSSQRRLPRPQVRQYAVGEDTLLWTLSKVFRSAMRRENQSIHEEPDLFPTSRPASKTSRGQDLCVLAACTEISNAIAPESDRRLEQESQRMAQVRRLAAALPKLVA